MTGLSRGKVYDRIKAFRDSHKVEYFTNLSNLMGYNSIDEVFKEGYPISYIEKFNDEASKLT